MVALPRLRPFVAAAAAVLAFSAYGCSSGEEPASREALGRSRLPIINGTPSPADQDSVVLLALQINGQMYPNCSGTVVAKNLVMTARHCVGQLDDKGNVSDYGATEIHVFTGADATKKATSGATPAANGKQIFTTGTTFLIPDISFVLLDRALSAPVASIRIEGGATQGEELTIVGFGIDQTNKQPAQRMQRTGVVVSAIGPTETKYQSLFGGEFEFGEAACSGDSGGPALDAKTHAVVGVASRVSNGKDRTDSDPSAFCIGSTTEDVYSSLQGVQLTLEKAFAAAGASPVLEGKAAPPDPAADPSSQDPSADPPADDAQDPAAPEKKPQSTSSDSSGCAAAPSRPSSGALALVLAALGVALARRRRAR